MLVATNSSILTRTNGFVPLVTLECLVLLLGAGADVVLGGAAEHQSVADSIGAVLALRPVRVGSGCETNPPRLRRQAQRCPRGPVAKRVWSHPLRDPEGTQPPRTQQRRVVDGVRGNQRAREALFSLANALVILAEA